MIYAKFKIDNAKVYNICIVCNVGSHEAIWDYRENSIQTQVICVLVESMCGDFKG